MMNRSWKEEITQELAQLQQVLQKRNLFKVEGAEGPWLILDNRKLLNLASNNYLGLAGDQRLKEAAIAALDKYGSGATASRLIVGNHPVYEQAESALIQWKGTEAGIIFNSGYTANIGVISAVAGRNDLVFSDRLNHASIVDGIILSRAEPKRYQHNDLNHLESLLKKAPLHKRKLIVTDTIFSMDGDMAQLEGLVELKERYNAMLMVDEAHSSGIYGPKGQGLAHHLQLQDRVDIQMGTFSKALGCFGAYVVGSKLLIDYLINKMRSFIFTTALPPAILGSIYAAIQIVGRDQLSRERLFNNSKHFRENLSQLGFNTCGSESQIIPIIIGPNDKTLLFSQRLQEEGIMAVGVRPPTVPHHQARIRFSVMANQELHELDWAIEKIALVGRETGIIT
jgi:8-amino-7-oxononanoate synthase